MDPVGSDSSAPATGLSLPIPREEPTTPLTPHACPVLLPCRLPFRSPPTPPPHIRIAMGPPALVRLPFRRFGALVMVLPPPAVLDVSDDDDDDDEDGGWYRRGFPGTGLFDRHGGEEEEEEGSWGSARGREAVEGVVGLLRGTPADAAEGARGEPGS